MTQLNGTSAITITAPGRYEGGLVEVTNDCGLIVTATGLVELNDLTIVGHGGLIGITHTGNGVLRTKRLRLTGFDAGSAIGVSLMPLTGSMVRWYSQDDDIGECGTGVLLKPNNSGGVKAFSNGLLCRSNIVGFKADGGGNTGGVYAELNNAAVEDNSSHGVWASNFLGSLTVVRALKSRISFNGGSGQRAEGANAFVVTSDSTVWFNGIAWDQQSGGAIYSFGDNDVNGNTALGTAPLAMGKS